MRRCGNEGRHPYLDATEKTTLQFLRTAIDFIAKAITEVGANMRNTSFIFAHPGNEFVITSGDGDWEFYFSKPGDQISVYCVRKPRYRYLWDGVKWVFAQILQGGRLALTAS